MNRVQRSVIAAAAFLLVGCSSTHSHQSHQSAAMMTMPDGTVMTAAQMAAPSAATAMDPNMVMATDAPSTLTVGGAPVAGRDPANQQQTTLGQAAGQAPPKILTNTQKVPVTVTRDNSSNEKLATGVPRANAPAPTISPGARQDGCAAGYGAPGQCIPLRAPGNKAWTCAALRVYFPNGFTAHPDQWNLDTDKNGMACDAGDAA